MADDLTLEVKMVIADVQAKMNQLVQEVGKLTTEVAKANVQHQQAATHAKAHHEALGKLGEQLKVVREKLGDFGEMAERVLRITGSVPSGGLMAPLLGGTAAIYGIAELVKGTMEWHTEIAHLSEVMNNNVQAASVWVGLAEELGIPVQSLEMGFRTLSQHIDLGSKALHDMGIATQDAQGRLMPLNTVLQEAQGWFHEHANSSLAAGRATELFGRAGLMLLPILEQDSSTFQAMTKELQDLGLIMDNTSLQKARQMDFELQHLGTVVHGLVIALGEPLVKALAVAGSSMSQAIIPHVQQIQQALNNLVSFIVGVISALTGWQFQLSATAQALGRVEDATASAGDATDALGSSSGAATEALKALREATREQVDALQDQIRALEEQDRAQQQSTDEQIRQLQLQSQQENFKDQQLVAAQRRQQKLADIARLQNEYEVALREGNLDHANTIFDQLAKARQEEATMEMEDQRQLHDYDRQQQEETLRRNLQAQKNAHQQEIQILQDKQKAIQEAAQKAEEAMSAAASGMSSAIIGSAGVIGGAAGQMQSSISDAGTEAGRNFGKAIKSAIGGIVKFFEESEPEREAQMSHWGDLAGQAFGNGMMTGIVNSFTPDNPGSDLALAIRPAFLQYVARQMGLPPDIFGKGYQSGGIIPGSYSMPQPIIAHGGEMVLNPQQQATLFGLASGGGRTAAGAGRATGPMNVTFNIVGVQDPAAVADAVRNEMHKLMGVL